MVSEGPLVPGLLDIDLRIAQMLMEIARHPTLSKTKNFSFLPPKYTTLYQLAQLPEEDVRKLIESGEIYPGMTGAEAKSLRFDYIVLDEFGRTLQRLSNFVLNRCNLDNDDLDKLLFSFYGRFTLQASPAKVREDLIPKLNTLLDRLQARTIEKEYETTQLIEDGDRIRSRGSREIADPEPDDEPSLPKRELRLRLIQLPQGQTAPNSEPAPSEGGVR